MQITLAQIDCQLGAVDANLARVEQVLDEAQTVGSDLVVFPELTLSGYGIGGLDNDVALRADDPRLLALGSRRDIDLLVGFPEDGKGVHTYNSAAYFEAGSLLHVHRKLYLPTYDIFEERKHFSPGQSLRAYPTRHGRMAVLTCNDAWQPQLAFVAAHDGARIMLLPTNSAQSRFPERYDNVSYWRDITRFYARMFQVYVVFVNRVGTEQELEFWGGSHVIDPWGTVVAEAPLGEEAVVTLSIDVDEVRRRRREVPLLKEARLGVLQRELQRLIDEGGDL